jgi:hypothetical protein
MQPESPATALLHQAKEHRPALERVGNTGLGMACIGCRALERGACVRLAGGR